MSPLLVNIVLDPLDKELTRPGHVFARYADDFLILVKCAKAAQRVMESLAAYVDGKLKLVVNRTKSRCAPLAECEFLGFKFSKQEKVKWTEKSAKRYKQKVKEITRRNRGTSAKDVIVELRRYVTGWTNYCGISHTYREVLELDEWMRRRVRLYYWTAPPAIVASFHFISFHFISFHFISFHFISFQCEAIQQIVPQGG